ncbi:proteasome subunit beta [Candidatus Nitronereus thalassa]|uniref:Proteasome subunit beta n=1 Tax=Candidatus Nitronereus thalassa TaxID=3020898 RepID=A0ABU3K3F9_9BACT|nr:proteasome subunit beta [Candidatus Nitronereus thalassa]MDT7040916.1 proteasome subunit beta [Candidatus Nitronereus thalassa]
MEWIKSSPAANLQCSSFFDHLLQTRPELTPAVRWGASWPTSFSADDVQRGYLASVTHGTTVLAIKFEHGVIIAGDRRATEGYQLAARTMEKVFKTDSHSAMAIAGAAGPCMEMAKLFEIELEHYEKLDGVQLSCVGKANRLGQMVKANLPMVMQGLVVIPLFVGFDLKLGQGRIFKYDVTGGRYEETDYHSIGSGGKDAKVTIKERYRRNLPEEEAIRLALQALFSAAEEDVGTGGPDTFRRIFPSMKLIDRAGVRDVEEPRVASMCEELAKARAKQD